MKAKFVYEAIGNIFKPKSKEDIMASIGDLSPNNLLYKSAESGFLPGVKKALEDGANVHSRNNLSLRWASYNGHYDIAKLLLDNGANVHAQNDEALHYASTFNYINIVKLLLKNGANVHAVDDDALRMALQYGNMDIVKLLKKYM